MARQVIAQGYDDCMKKIEENKGTSPMFILFTGSEDPSTGHSWCPDCVKADPVIESSLKKAPKDSLFIYCQVGTRDFWKDKANAFRKCEKFRVSSVPTLVQNGTPKRLVESECSDVKLVEMFFEED